MSPSNAAASKTAPRAVRVRRASLTVADLAGTERFYREGLGFVRIAEAHACAPSYARLTGIAGVRAEVVVLRLGAQEIELVAFDPPGRPYPRDSTAADLWFQHLAIVVSDMARAYEHVGEQPGFTSISQDGPQQLPPGSGSVAAFKFRDPEGHPLELIRFPPKEGPAAPRPVQRALFLGIDHSAIDVADIAKSVDFYTRLLGLSVASRSLNNGPEQALLDGLGDARVDVIALGFRDREAPPHIELLGYRTPSGRRLPAAASANDVATTRLVLEAEGLAALECRLRAQSNRFVISGPLTLHGGSRAMRVSDPDGHALMLTEAA